MRVQPLVGIALALLLTTHAAVLAKPLQEAAGKSAASEPRPSFSSILASLSVGATLGQLVLYGRRRRKRGSSEAKAALAAPERSRAGHDRPARTLHRHYT